MTGQDVTDTLIQYAVLTSGIAPSACSNSTEETIAARLNALKPFVKELIELCSKTGVFFLDDNRGGIIRAELSINAQQEEILRSLRLALERIW